MSGGWRTARSSLSRFPPCRQPLACEGDAAHQLLIAPWSLTPCEQPVKPLLRFVVPHCDRQRLPLAEHEHQLLPPRDARVNQVALEREVLLGRQRDDDTKPALGRTFSFWQPPGIREFGEDERLQASRTAMAVEE